MEEQGQEEGNTHETHDEIEKFIAEMEKDQDLWSRKETKWRHLICI